MSSQENPFKFFPNEQRTEATIEFDGTRVHVTTEQLENAIAHLGLLRSYMNPPIPPSPDKDRIFPIVDLPAIQRLGITTENGATVHFRSDRFGWFQVFLPAEWCSGLVAYLQGENVPTPKIDSTAH